ncbi:hypothetical protein TNCV_601301 [Trichonephila clavipes]|nr:hypothetical protein TNCV_601301 [Trichonephila clavipes]
MGNGKFLQSLTFQDRRLESGRTKHSNEASGKWHVTYGCLPRNGAYLLIRILELRAEIVILLKIKFKDIIKMGRTILLERRQSESVGRRNSRTTFLRSDWPRPFARREVGVEMELGRSENKRPEQRRS